MTPEAPAGSVSGALARAEELRRAGRHDEGIALLLDALRSGDQKAQVLFRLGNLYFDRGDLVRAEHAYRRATEEDPQYAAAHHNLGVVYRRQGKVSQSVRMLKKAQWLDVRHPRMRDGTPVQRAVRRWWARPGIVVPLVLFGIVVLVLWLTGRLF